MSPQNTKTNNFFTKLFLIFLTALLVVAFIYDLENEKPTETLQSIPAIASGVTEEKPTINTAEIEALKKELEALKTKTEDLEKKN